MHCFEFWLLRPSSIKSVETVLVGWLVMSKAKFIIFLSKPYPLPNFPITVITVPCYGSIFLLTQACTLWVILNFSLSLAPQIHCKSRCLCLPNFSCIHALLSTHTMLTLVQALITSCSYYCKSSNWSSCLKSCPYSNPSSAPLPKWFFLKCRPITLLLKELQ